MFLRLVNTCQENPNPLYSYSSQSITIVDSEWNEFFKEFEKYPNFKIDQEFLEQVNKNEGRIPKLSKQKLEELEKQFYKEIWKANE